MVVEGSRGSAAWAAGVWLALWCGNEDNVVGHFDGCKSPKSFVVWSFCRRRREKERKPKYFERWGRFIVVRYAEILSAAAEIAERLMVIGASSPGAALPALSR